MLRTWLIAVGLGIGVMWIVTALLASIGLMGTPLPLVAAGFTIWWWVARSRKGRRTTRR